MKLFAAWLGFAPLFLVGLMSAADVDVDEFSDDDGDEHRHVFHISANTGSSQALVVRSTRWENGVKVLVMDEIRCQPPGTARCRIALAELAPNYWHLSETPVEQHLQGVRLVKRERTPAGVIIELQPAGDGVGARRRYLFEWEARLEKWHDLDRRYPDLPAHPAGAEWVQRRIIFPVLPAAGS
jgi:hypothetical protein